MALLFKALNLKYVGFDLAQSSVLLYHKNFLKKMKLKRKSHKLH